MVKRGYRTSLMTGPRRRELLVAGGTLIAAPSILHGQTDWPNRAVRYINPFPAGGATDTLSRLYCQKMTEITGQQWIVENRGGSGGNVGVDVVAKAPPDGYTLGLGGVASHAIAPTLYAKLPFDVNKDFTFVSNLWQLPNMLVINLDLPAKNVTELVDLLKKNPGKYSYGSAGNGTTLHLSGELFKLKAGVDILHVPYRGAAPAMQDILAGQIHMIFDNIPGALAQYRPGRVRGIAVTSLQRSPAVPRAARRAPRQHQLQLQVQHPHQLRPQLQEQFQPQPAQYHQEKTGVPQPLLGQPQIPHPRLKSKSMKQEVYLPKAELADQ